MYPRTIASVKDKLCEEHSFTYSGSREYSNSIVNEGHSVHAIPAEAGI